MAKRERRKGEQLFVSPLRYPGGKRKLVDHIATKIVDAVERPLLFIEPFAGGAAVSLNMLVQDWADHVVLADLDPLVGNFWRVVFGPQRQFDELRRWTETSAVTLKDWYEVKAMLCATPVEYAFKCLYLNRTSFSGVLNQRAGPIGGHAQASEYTVDCRFNKDRIFSGLDRLRDHRKRVVYAGVKDYRQIAKLKRVRDLMVRDQSVVWYLDPPFFRKAEYLYNKWFDHSKHLALKNWIENDLVGHWLLSYDNVPEALQVWGDHPGTEKVELGYSSSCKPRHDDAPRKRQRSTEIVVSGYQACPEVIHIIEQTRNRIATQSGNDRNVKETA